MKNLSSLLSSKYLKFKKKDRNIALMIKVCFLGIFIGTFSLMLTLIIMNGFEKTIHDKMQGINSQVIIYAPGNKLDYENIKNTLLDEFDEIEAVSGSSLHQVLINQNKTQSILFLKGIDPESEGSVTNITEKITFPLTSKENQQNLLPKLLQNNEIIIGYKTAQNLNLKVGDQINLLIPEPASDKKIFLNKKSVKVSGIFKIGLEEYDNNFAFCSLDLMHNLFKEKKGVDQISLKLKPLTEKLTIFPVRPACPSKPWRRLEERSVSKSFKIILKKLLNIFSFQDKEELIIKNLQSRLPMLTVCSWKDLYPALVSSLKLEKYVMFFILALITLVSCMTMVSLLFMYIQQKRRDIAILKSMGLSNKKIRSIFLRIGLTITFWASSSGLGLAALAGFLLEKYPFIQLPDVYYVSYLPARMDLEIFIVVFVATMMLGFFATWIPAQRTKRINIAQVLRQE